MLKGNSGIWVCSRKLYASVTDESPQGRFPEEIQLYMAASLPRPFFCVQNPSCTPAFTTDHNSFFTKLRVSPSSNWTFLVGRTRYFCGLSQQQTLTFPAFDNAHIHSHSHFVPLLWESPMRTAWRGFFTSYSRQSGNNKSLVYLAASHHSRRPCQPAF